jgi:archaellum component FlaC
VNVAPVKEEKKEEITTSTQVDELNAEIRELRIKLSTNISVTNALKYDKWYLENHQN